MLNYVKLIFAVINTRNEVTMLNICDECSFIETGWFRDEEWESGLSGLVVTTLNDIIVDGNYEFEFENMYTSWRMGDASKGSAYVYTVKLEDPAFIPMPLKCINIEEELKVDYKNTETSKVLNILKHRF